MITIKRYDYRKNQDFLYDFGIAYLRAEIATV